jgi:hypothetical protein
MIESLRAEVKRKFDRAFVLPRSCFATFLHGVIDTWVLPSDKVVPVDKARKKKQRNELNALLNRESELKGSEVADKDVRRAFEACFVIIDRVCLRRAKDVRLFDLKKLYLKYPEVDGVDDEEAGVLLKFRNVMMTALLSIPAAHHKEMLIDICVRLSEGASASAKYSRGGGTQTDASTNREIIFERESKRDPKLCREANAERRTPTGGPLIEVTNKNAVMKKRPRAELGVTAVPRKQPRTGQTGVKSGAVKANAAKRQRIDLRPDALDRFASDQHVLVTVSNAEIETILCSLMAENYRGDDEERRDMDCFRNWWDGGVSLCPEHWVLDSNVLQDAALHISCADPPHISAAIECDPCSGVD